MAKSQQAFNKSEREKARLKKRKDKLQRQEERKANPGGTGLEDMLAWVDENGNITNTPPDPTKKIKIDAESIEISTPKREEKENSAIKFGRVDFLNDAKGFGFIRELETQEKYFVHVNGLLEAVKENDKVSFELERGMKGMNAVRVKKV
jgi:cold shock CspA family protein